ncbi:hypothetical protein [Pseudonocardia acidicola]|uniref:Uncharacterized protein n=1 Tax=Pseudonocardia acidicola TaxID=2724939 RepID=A0ABX1SMU6_9PSEU|nr:hypothetical protein [Pseudonocardia acidicola]NMI01600.1 hypothetical protein [Pseudonocardia acidicola]
MSEMTGSSDPDDALIRELGVALGWRTSPPREVVEAAKESFTWRTVDAELAALGYDSLLDDGPALARAADQPRILAFEADALSVEVEIDQTPGARRMLGQLVPAQAAELELRSPSAGPVRGTADDLGRFALPLPGGRGPVSLRCRLADGRTVHTSWLTL